MEDTRPVDSKAFYDNWLAIWSKCEDQKSKARKVIHPEELEWIRTRQDARAALLIAPETGFRTIGTISMVAEIPEGWHTGRHSHGEEAMYIVDGEKGFSVINNQRFDWEKGACIRIPFGAVHQHFNTGSKQVRYYSVLAPHLEALCLVGKFEQFEDCGQNDSSESNARTATNKPKYVLNEKTPDHDEKGRRIVAHLKDARTNYGGELLEGVPRTSFLDSLPKEMLSAESGKAHHARSIMLMGSSPDFMGEEVEITHIMCDAPHSPSGKHAHMEALIYVLQGEGYTIIDGQRFDWRPGMAIHIQGPQTVHQHFNTSDVESQYLRAHNCVRAKFFQSIAKEKFPYLYFETRK